MDYKIISAIISAMLVVVFFAPYLRDILKRKTKPHTYTWLIWTITQGTALAGIWYGGGGAGSWAILVSTIVVFLIFLLSLKYGTKNITKTDTVILILAIVAILVWWKLNNPIAAILMVTLIDFLGFIPSYRKTFHEPWSETLISWIGSAVSYIFAIIALREYNVLTLTYLATMIIANIIMILICSVRRRFISK